MIQGLSQMSKVNCLILEQDIERGTARGQDFLDLFGYREDPSNDYQMTDNQYLYQKSVEVQVRPVSGGTSKPIGSSCHHLTLDAFHFSRAWD